MALWDLSNFGGMAPSEPAPPSGSPLPIPPIDFNNIGSMIGNLGSQAIFGQSPQQVGQDFSNLGSGVQSGLSWLNNSGTADFAKQLGEYAYLPAQAFDPSSDLRQLLAGQTPTPKITSQLGSLVNRGLDEVVQATEPPVPGMTYEQYAPGASGYLTGIHGGAIALHGVGNLMQDSPEIERKLVDSFRQGFLSSNTSKNVIDDPEGHAAVDKLMGGIGQVTGDLFDPKLLNQAIYSGMKNNGANDESAQATAAALAEPIANLASFVSGPTGKLMLIQFAGSMLSHPGDTVNAMKQSGGDFFNLLGTTANWSARGGHPPSAEEISKGLLGLANTIGILHATRGVASAGLGKAGDLANAASEKLAARNIDKLQKQAIGESPSGANEIADQVGQAALDRTANEMPNDPSAINFGSTLNRPEYAGFRNAVANASRISDDEIASEAQNAGAKIYDAGTPADQRGGTGFILKNGQFVELPQYAEGYRQHSRLVEDMGLMDRESGAVPVTDPNSNTNTNNALAVDQFTKNTGALRVSGKTGFSSYGLPDSHVNQIVDTLSQFRNNPYLGVSIDNIRDGKSYSFEIQDLANNNWDLNETLTRDARSYNIPRLDDYAQNLRQARQAGTASQASQANQIGPAEATSPPGPSNQVGTGAESPGAPAAQQTDQGFQREGVPEANTQSVSFVGEHAQSIPDSVKNELSNALKEVDPFGWIRNVNLMEHGGDINNLGSWDPLTDARSINLDMKNIAPIEVHETLYTLKNHLQQSIKKYGDDPKRASALSNANQVLATLAKSLSPENIMKWIASHEALHATLGKIYDYPPGGSRVDVTKDAMLSHAGEALQMIRHMDSTSEGRAWLNHAATQMGLKGEVGQLRVFARSAGDMNLNSFYESASKIPSVTMERIVEAKQRVNEALVHAVLNDKDLSPYPYYLHSGEKAHAASYWEPEATQESARLAGAYFDRYSTAIAPTIADSRTGAATGLQTAQRGAPRSAVGDDSDQTRLTPEALKGLEFSRSQAQSRWRAGLTDMLNRLDDLRSNENADPKEIASLEADTTQLQANLQHLTENPNATVEQALEAGRNASAIKHPDIFENPLNTPPIPVESAQPEAKGRVTPEGVQASLQKLQSTPPEEAVVKNKTLAEINSMQPPPQHFTDERLTEADRNKLARYAISQMNQLQKKIDLARGNDNSEANMRYSIQKLGMASFWKKFFEEKPINPEVSTKPIQPVDYHIEAQKIASYSPAHPLASLKDLANQTIQSSAEFDRASSSGLSPADLAQIQGKMQFAMTKFRSAYDLYTSKVFKENINKQSYDWKQTRSIGRRIASIDAPPVEKAHMTARLIGEQILNRRPENPYTLQEAGQDIAKTSMGLSKVAKNWNPEVKKALAGELWNVARKAWAEDPSLPLGVKNIPVHDMSSEPSTLEDLRDSHGDLQKEFNDQLKQFNMQRDKAKILESTGRLAKGTVARMDKEQQIRNLNFSNERLKLQARIDNHPLTVQTRAINHSYLDLNSIEEAANPSEEAAIRAYGDNPNLGKPIETLIAEAEALNERLNQAVPNPFSVESFMDEGRNPDVMETEETGQVHPNNGQPWFTPGWSKALTDIREMGGYHSILGDLTQDLLSKMGEHMDPSRSMMHPAQWFKAHWEALAGIPHRVHQIEHVLQQIVQDSRDVNFSKAILRSIDDQNEVEHFRELGSLTPEQAKLARFLNEYWKATREQFKDPELGADPLIGHFVDNYVPHIVLKDPDGNALFDAKKNAWSRKSGFAKERIQRGAVAEPVFKTLEDLESRGYQVEYNLAKVFSAHANSTFRMMKIKEMMNTLKGTIYSSPDGTFKGFPIVSVDQLARLKMNEGDYKGLDILDQPGARVRFGPGDSMFQQYRVHPELARSIERLASSNDLRLPGMGPARALRTMGGLFKFIQFSINPRHAFNIFSNVANLHSPFGVMDPTVFRNIYGRANRAMLPVDRSSLSRRLGSNLPATEMKNAFSRKSEIEKDMRSLFDVMQNEGIDLLDPMPTHMTPRQADLWDRFNGLRTDLLDQHRILDKQLATRDRQLLANLMDKGLVPDRDLIEGADLNALSNYSERIPVMKQFHRWMWHDVVWRGQIGTAMHLSDQFTMKAAKSAGWDGKGGAGEAEKYLDPDMIDGIQREAVYYSKQATGLMNKLDMSTNWQVYGRATLLSAPWTMGQLQSARDSVGNNAFSKLLGRQDFSQVSDRQLESGFTKDKAQYLDAMHTKLARRMVYAGSAKLAMTSLFAGTIGSWLMTNQLNTPVQNFLRDPMHTFDVYAGRDPATQHALWIDNPFFGFQHELVNYAMAGVKAAMEGKNPLEVGVAPLVRFASKANPMIGLTFDSIFQVEVTRYLAGLDPSMASDADLQNLHGALQPALDRLGIPDMGAVEDRLLYALRVMTPSPGGFASTAVKRDSSGQPILDDNGNEIPLTDPRSVLNDFGIGGFLNPALDAVNVLGIPTSPSQNTMNIPGALGNLEQDIANPKLAEFAAGTSQTISNPLYQADASSSGLSIKKDPKGYFQMKENMAQSKQNSDQYMAGQLAMVKIGNLAAKGTPEAYVEIGQIRDQSGLTDAQVVNAILHSTSVVSDKKVHKSAGIVGKQPASGKVIINGQELTEEQSTEYNKMKNNRQLYTIQQIQNSTAFKQADSSTKAMMVNQVLSVADKFTTAQAGQAYLGTGGTKVTDGDFKELIGNTLDARENARQIIQSTPAYSQADAQQKVKMLQSYSSMVDTIAWDKQFGNLKTLSPEGFQALIVNSVYTETNTLEYLHQTPFYQGVSPADQISLDKEYGNLAKQINLDIFTGKVTNMPLFQVPTYVQSVVNTEETSKYLLHQTDFYNESSLTDQQKLDSKYNAYSRTIALKAWREGRPILDLNSAGQAYQAGSQKLIVGRLLAEQGYNDLQNQFGGPKMIQTYQQQLADMKKQVRENVNATPTQLSRMQTILGKQFEAANPQYAQFLKARKAWERGTSAGKLYLALNADEQALAQTDTSIISDATGINIGGILDQSIDDTMLNASDTGGVSSYGENIPVDDTQTIMNNFG